MHMLSARTRNEVTSSFSWSCCTLPEIRLALVNNFRHSFGLSHVSVNFDALRRFEEMWLLTTCLRTSDPWVVLLPVCTIKYKIHPVQIVHCSQVSLCSPHLAFSSVNKSRGVLKCFLGVCRTGSRAVLLLAHRENSAPFRIHSYVIRWCCSASSFAPCPLGKFCQELKSAYLDLEIENSRTLCNARIRAL